MIKSVVSCNISINQPNDVRVLPVPLFTKETWHSVYLLEGDRPRDALGPKTRKLPGAAVAPMDLRGAEG